MLPTRRRVGRLVTTLAIAAAPLVAIAATPSAAHADTDDCGVTGNLVANCGFETGDASGWTLTPAANGSLFLVESDDQHSGSWSAWFAATGSQDDTLTQTIAGTVAGATYTASFWAMNGVASDSHIVGTVSDTDSGTVTIVDQVDPSTSWTEYSTTFTAGSSAPTLSIGGYNGPNLLAVDDISVATVVPVLPSSVPDATYGTAYSTSIEPTGGTPPYTLSVSSGALPPGLSLDASTGLISGTPTAAGDYSFTVDASDSATTPGTAEQTYTLSVAKATPAVTFSTPPTDGVVGQADTVSADSTSAEGAITYVSDTAGTCSVSGATVTYLHPGTCTVEADQAVSANYLAGSTTTTIAVGQAATTTSVAVHPDSITADVAVTSPGAGDPTGTVTFSVGGSTVGSAPVTGGTATLDYVVPTGATQQVAAVYSGDTDFATSSDSTSRQDPTITAQVTSRRPASHAGWFRTPVRVTFTCTTNGAPLTAACPAPVVLDHDGAGQSVARTILATDGGADTVAVTGIDIDQHAPSVRVAGIRNGATYGGHAPAARCVATDRLSGVASCRITRHTRGGVTRYTATATDRAGNTASAHGSYRVLGTYLVGAPYSHGTFQVHRKVYSLVTHAATRPRYLNAAPAGVRPAGGDVPFKRIGHNTWAITVSLAALPHGSRWNLGIEVGGKLRIVKVQVH